MRGIFSKGVVISTRSHLVELLAVNLLLQGVRIAKCLRCILTMTMLWVTCKLNIRTLLRMRLQLSRWKKTQITCKLCSGGDYMVGGIQTWLSLHAEFFRYGRLVVSQSATSALPGRLLTSSDWVFRMNPWTFVLFAALIVSMFPRLFLRHEYFVKQVGKYIYQYSEGHYLLLMGIYLSEFILFYLYHCVSVPFDKTKLIFWKFVPKNGGVEL